MGKGSDASMNERRRHERFETDVKVQFYVSFDLQTKVDYQVKERPADPFSPTKYSAVSRNVSAEGLSFLSAKKLEPGNQLFMEVYVPSAKNPVRMEGEVRWCETIPAEERDEGGEEYITGVRIATVENSLVEKSIIIDPYHKIIWSVVLESIFGNFKHLMLKRKASSTKS